MGMTVKDLFKISLFKNAKLIAGNKGINNEIVWFNLMEIIDVVNSLEKGEFLITTGYGFNEDKISKNLIYKLKNRGLSGLGIQLGYYINNVPNHMLEEADDLGFPIINIPPKITFSMITKSLYKELTLYQQEEVEYKTKNDIKNIILDILENKKINFERMNYLRNLFYQVENRETRLMIFSISHKYDGIILRTDIDDGVGKIIDILRQNKCLIHNEIIRGNNLILFSYDHSIRFMEIYNMLEMSINLLSDLYENLIFTIGISSKLNEIDDIKKGYYEAESSQQQLKKIQATRGIIRIEDCDLLTLFLKESTRKDTIEFASSILNPIINYDKENQSEYLKLIEYFIFNDCNISVTSEQLYVHRHTLRYRLEKINKLFNMDYMNNISMMKYRLAFLIYNYFF